MLVILKAYILIVVGYRSFLVLGMGLLFSACAAQKAYLNSARTEELVQKASELAPMDPDVERAKISLEAGKMAIDQARFGLAERKFAEADRLANKILTSGESSIDLENRSILQSDPREFSKKDPEAISVQSSNFGQNRVVPEPTIQETRQELEKKQRKSLPAEALAQYLRNKSNNPASESHEKLVAAPVPVPIPSAQKLPPQKSLVQPAKESPQKQGNLPPPSLEDQAESLEVIEAPSEVAAKVPPVLPAEPEPEKIVAAVSTPEKSQQKPQHEMRKMPAVVIFPPKEEALNDSAMAELDKVSRFLVKNPSNTLVFKAIKGPNEPNNLIDDRYQSVVSYLSARGVPEDQIRLSNERFDGRSASFELYLIEH